MIVGSCAKCGQKLFHDSRFVSQGGNVWCADHAPERPLTPAEEKDIVDRFLRTVSRVPTREEIAEAAKALEGRTIVIGEAEDDGVEGFMEPAKRGPVVNEATKWPTPCSRCRARLPMDGADFCEWCAKDDDFDYTAVVRHSTTVIKNKRDCPACRAAIRRDDVQYRVGQVWYHAACAYRISKEARDAADPAGFLQPLLGGKKSSTVSLGHPSERERSNMQQAMDRREAAERLAFLVLNTATEHRPDGGWGPVAIGAVWLKMVAEAERVLGMKP